jgi:hypothetical protein
MKIKSSTLKSVLTFAFIVFVVIVIDAQCPMCRMSAESNLKAGGTEGKALNSGILYLLSLPYLAISVIGYIWFKNRKKFENNQEG